MHAAPGPQRSPSPPPGRTAGALLLDRADRNGTQPETCARPASDCCAKTTFPVAQTAGMRHAWRCIQNSLGPYLCGARAPIGISACKTDGDTSAPLPPPCIQLGGGGMAMARRGMGTHQGGVCKTRLRAGARSGVCIPWATLADTDGSAGGNHFHCRANKKETKIRMGLQGESPERPGLVMPPRAHRWSARGDGGAPLHPPGGGGGWKGGRWPSPCRWPPPFACAAG